MKTLLFITFSLVAFAFILPLLAIGYIAGLIGFFLNAGIESGVAHSSTFLDWASTTARSLNK